VADDISNRELAGRMDDLRISVRELVGRPEYTAYQRDIEHRLGGLSRDLAALRERHDRDVREVSGRLDKAAEDAKEHRLSLRTVIYTGLLPALVVLLGILVQIWLAHQGGHG
jgi:hypothetical protein